MRLNMRLNIRASIFFRYLIGLFRRGVRVEENTRDPRYMHPFPSPVLRKIYTYFCKSSSIRPVFMNATFSIHLYVRISLEPNMKRGHVISCI